MIKIVNDINEYLDWIDSLCFDPCFSTPFCDKARVIAVSNKENHRLICAYDGDRLTGIFCLLILEEEKYIETVFLYTKEKKAYEDLMDYLSEQLFIIRRMTYWEIICQRNRHFSIPNRDIWNTGVLRKRMSVK